MKHISLLLLVVLIVAGGCALDPGSEQPSTQPPPYPENILCACGDHQLTLSWDAVPGAEEYNIYMAKYSGLSSTNYEQFITVGSISYTWTNLSNDRNYYFVLSSTSSAGEGEHSPELSGMPRDPYSAADLERLLGSGMYNYDRFGCSVDIDGDHTIMGAWSDDADGYTDRGTAFIFRRTGLNSWEEVAKLAAAEPGGWYEFGRAVAISGDYAVVGTPRADGLCGSAYVFHRTGGDSWDAGTKLVAPVRVDGDQFGYSVSISGDYVVVGLIWRTEAYVFHRTGENSWDSGAELTAPEGNFGHTLAINGDYVVASSQDAAFVFRRTGLNSWDSGTKLVAPDGGDGFGAPVDIDGDYVIVGAGEQAGSGTAQGAAYVFQRTGVATWDAGIKLVDPDPGNWNRFGSSVAISGNYVITMANGEQKAFAFRRIGPGNTWDGGNELTTPAAGGFAGNSVAIDGYYGIIGASGENTSRGAAYAVYAFPR